MNKMIRLTVLLSGLPLITACTGMSGGQVDGQAGVAITVSPNIVLVLADDQGWRDSGAYGNPDLKTPNIDRLAREGMKFTHAFTASTKQLRKRRYPQPGALFPGPGIPRRHLG
jgi:hypothetical protein